MTVQGLVPVVKRRRQRLEGAGIVDVRQDDRDVPVLTPVSQVRPAFQLDLIRGGGGGGTPVPVRSSAARSRNRPNTSFRASGGVFSSSPMKLWT